MTATVRRVLRGVAALAVLTGTVIGFIAGFATNPLIDYAWAVPIVLALLSLALLLNWVGTYEP